MTPRQMDFCGTEVSCRQCGTTLIHHIAIPSSPTPHLHRTLQLPEESEALDIKSYISNADHLIGTLDADLALLHDITERVRTTRNEVHIARAAHQAILSPIRRLPREILTAIFWLSCPVVDNRSSTRERLAPFYLGQVCTSWRTIAFGTPMLWSQIWLGAEGPWNRSLVEEWIQRSGNVPLTIGVLYPNSRNKRAETVSRIWQLLIRESSRWRSAYICLRREMLLASFSQLHGHLPLLESIYIPYQSQSIPDTTPFDFLEDAPNLRQLELGTYIQTENLPNALNRLTHLKLSNVFDYVESCLDILALTPNLMVLVLEYDTWLSDLFDPSRPMITICLKDLQRLQFEGLGDPSPILDHLETPSLVQISLTLDEHDVWLTEHPLLSFLRRSSRSLRSLHVRCYYSDDDSPIQNIVECLRLIPEITALTIAGECDWAIDATMESLIVRQHEPPLLPMLEELEFAQSAFNPWLLADMVGSRCFRSDTDSRCSKLRAVRVRLLDSPTFEPGNRQAWVDRFNTYRKESGLNASVIVEASEIIL